MIETSFFHQVERPFDWPSAPGRAFMIALGTLVLMICIAMAAHADDGARPVVTGWIDSFEGNAADYALHRDSRVLPVYPLMPLWAGDRIELGEDAGPMRIHISETERLLIDRSESPYSVPASAELAGPWANLLEWVGGLFDGHGHGHGGTKVELKSRGDSTLPPTSGLLFTQRMKVVAGKRPLALAWTNGEAPFGLRLALDGKDMEPVLEAADLTETIWISPELELAPGSYLLEIRDGQHRDLITEIKVVEPDSAPKPDPGLLPKGLSDHARRILGAAWLDARDGGWIWRLEAYQSIADITDAGAAIALRNALMTPDVLPINR